LRFVISKFSWNFNFLKISILEIFKIFEIRIF
jgi:hypothetical protein